MDKSILIKANINYDEGVKRMMGDPEFYEQMLMMFLDDKSIPESRAAIENGDTKALFEASHGLKGVSGNLSISGVFDASSHLVALIRAGDTDNIESAFNTMAEEWQKAYDAIKAAGATE